MSAPVELRYSRPALGTFVEIRARGKNAREAIYAAYSRIEKVQRLMSFHDPESELSRINREAHLHPVPVHPWTAEVFATALDICRLTDGLFDISVGSALVQRQFLPDLVQRNSTRCHGAAIRVVGSEYVTFEEPLLVDLGGIAKGFAVDKAIEVLQEMGITSGTVNAGGDLRVFGPTSVPIFVRCSRPGQAVQLLELAEGAIATSADYYSRKRWKGCSVTPLFHPRLELSPESPYSVSVQAETCMIADATTKVAVLDPGYRIPWNCRVFTADAQFRISERTYEFKI